LRQSSRELNHYCGASPCRCGSGSGRRRTRSPWTPSLRGFRATPLLRVGRGSSVRVQLDSECSSLGLRPSSWPLRCSVLRDRPSNLVAGVPPAPGVNHACGRNANREWRVCYRTRTMKATSGSSAC